MSSRLETSCTGSQTSWSLGRHVYSVLSDGNVKVRKHALMVLGHLVLSNMLKVKGRVSAS